MTEPSPMAARLHDSIRANRDIRIPLNHTMAAYMAPELMRQTAYGATRTGRCRGNATL